MRSIPILFGLLTLCELQPCVGATLCVKLRSAFSKAVPGVLVRFVDPKDNGVVTGITNSIGEFCAAELRPGSYSIEVRPDFYIAATYLDVVIAPAGERWIELELYAREIRGFEVLSHPEIVGQIEGGQDGEKLTRICVEKMTVRNCAALSKWGEYRLEIPSGRISVWFETDGGAIRCKKELTIRSKDRISVACSF